MELKTQSKLRHVSVFGDSCHEQQGNLAHGSPAKGPISRRFDRVACLLERNALWCVGMFSLVYFVSTLRAIRNMPLWLDEVGAYYVARLSAPDMLRVLRQGADIQPPFFGLSLHSLAVTGNPVLMRLPAMIGVWCMVVCLYCFVARRRSRLHGLVAMFCPFVTEANDFAWQARPYGIVLGGTTAALLCWQSLDTAQWRRGKLVALWFCCSLVVANHYYGFLILLPLAAGEAVRWRNGRRDAGVAVALTASLLPLIAAFPIAHSVRGLGMTYWGHPDGKMLKDIYEEFLQRSLLPLCSVFIAVLLTRALTRDSEQTRNRKYPGFPDPELVVIGALVALPFAGMALGLFTGAISPRYVIACLVGVCAGFACILPVGRKATLAAVLVLGVGITGRLAVKSIRGEHYEQPQVPAAAVHAGEQAIVYAAPHQFVEAHFYAPASVADRMFYLSDPSNALRWTKQDAIDYFMQSLGRISDCHVVEYSAFMRQHPHFVLVAGNRDSYAWLLGELTSEGAAIQLLSAGAEGSVYEVSGVTNGVFDKATSNDSPRPL